MDRRSITSKINAQKAGRKKGSLSKTTLERLEVLKAFRQKVLGAADVLFNAQLHSAVGRDYLYKIKKYYEGTGKNRVLKTKKPQLVTDQNEIQMYLTEQVEQGDLHDPEATYYFITAERPDTRASDSLLDRGLGKVPSALLAEDEEGNQTDIKITGMLIIKEPDAARIQNKKPQTN
jgi:hypothetical protein